LSGDDELALPFNAAGGVGCISVTANVAPKLCAEFQRACADNDLARARELNDKLYPLHYAMFEDASPGPVKYALSRVHDWVPSELRLPLVPCGEAARKAVDAALVHAGVL
ncbi:MAG: dihydrodipicolinate synthase family protein, partial [Novosphingobium sp.]|nr:dihydrodipicolinate synthase family protein [Novosphingobium sp.]